ncbi:MAG: glycosyl transferase family protein [Rhodospirillaceae bacterium]|nr:glycosyl transferase family protein [Rhodospirillaceae bacterium]
MAEHEFAKYIRILARGKTKSRSLTGEEAEAAMAMVLGGEVESEQLGAFLMLMRLKEETAEEVTGFTRAARASLGLPSGAPVPDLDWSSYAGKRRQLPWFLLAAMVLVQGGVRIFMHGTDGHTEGRLYTGAALSALGLPVTRSLDEAAAAIGETGFAYLPLGQLSPKLDKIINLKPILGLRSPVHTVARLLNPLRAPHLLQGIFHPSFMPIHQQAMRLLGEPAAMVFRGEGGEIERRPNKALSVSTVHAGTCGEDHWPASLADPLQAEDGEMDIGRLAAVWSGADDDAYGIAAITGTLAIALKLLGRADNVETAQREAEVLWQARNHARMALAV